MRAVPTPTREPIRVGARLRAARTGLGLTLDQVASAAGLTKGFLSGVERDDKSPSVATLVALCEVLSIPVGSLFESPAYDLTRESDAPRIVSLSSDQTDEVLLTPRAQSALQIVKSVYPPNAQSGEELYTISADAEVAHILEGQLEIQFPTYQTILHPGDTLTFSGREPHSWRNPSADEQCVVIWVFVPAPWSVGSGGSKDLVLE